ncbi:MAG: tRNA (adenosine(37)-N6)-dimethylallyltransferase MiaA [Lachnospiraceae bacterium]|nr:tRNA (adenosine(37)-N6)-dimethylallyltransferase MiaA [Lachnospiraceae bacterium]
MSGKDNTLIVIGGPTASGKSEIAVELARKIGGEVVSADSMQVYKYMDIGSAKITLEEMMGIPHYMIDVAEPTEEFHVARYAHEAKECIKSIQSRGKTPILCGGTGFYIQAVAYDIDFSDSGADENYRRELAAYAERAGSEALHRRLQEIDPESAKSIHPNNLKRVIRALEYYRETGETMSDHNARESGRTSPYNLHFFVVTCDRQTLYERIDRRVDFMMEMGLLDEVRYLQAMGLRRDMVSMQGLGYKEMLDYLDGKYDLSEAVRILKRDSRHYAKRQLTWFKREKEAVWINREDYGNDTMQIVDHIAACCS